MNLTPVRRLVAPFLRAKAPGCTACHHCGWPWTVAEQHCVEYAKGRSVFFACSRCWPLLTPADRLRYAAEVVLGSGTGWRWNQAWDEASADLVLEAVGALNRGAS